MNAPYHWLIIAVILFTVGALGVFVRKNSIVVFMCIELMLNAVNLTFVAFSQIVGNLQGQIAVFFVMVVAAAEAAVGLAIILLVFRNQRGVETSDSAELKW